MSESALAHFNRLVEAAIARKDGEGLCRLLRESTDETVAAINDFYANGGPLPSGQSGWESLPDVVKYCFTTAGAIRMNDWVDAFEHMNNALSAFINILSNESDWCLPLFHQLCDDVRIIAQEADDQLRSDHRKPCKLESAERVLKRGFTVVNNDRREVGQGSRRIGALGIINQLLKVYFKINNLGLCVNLTRTVSTSSFPPFHVFPLQHRVTYKYYAGRLSLYDDHCSEAVESLMYAMQHTPYSEGENRRRIMLYLVPAKILTGSLPSQSTLERYRMKWYVDIVSSIKTGDFSLFEKGMSTHQEFFIKTALYLAVEKMKPLAYRALIRKVAYICDQNKISLNHIRVSLSMCSVKIDRDEVECILANLIFQNFIKGYVSHKVGYLVLSKKNPFPSIDSLS